MHPVLRASAVAFALLGASVAARGDSKLEQVAAFDHQVTGVTVSETGRVFVNFPRWTEDAPVSVAEVAGDGSIKPYPDADWNAWRNAKRFEMSSSTHFVCVQSVVADGRGSLWVLDPAAPAQSFIVPGGPKLVQIDLASNGVKRAIPFDETVAPQGSYLNDVRFSPDGRHAYITDSGAVGALVVVDLASGHARRVLSGHKSTQVEPKVVVQADGKPLRRPDGRGVEFAADGIALSKEGDWLYWQAIKGKTLYRLATSLLNDPSHDAELPAKVQRVGENGVADGLLIAADGRMIVTAPEEDALKVRVGEQDPTVLIKSKDLRWPDTLSQSPSGDLYVTTSRIQDMVWFKPDSPAALPTRLWKVTGK